MIIIYYIILGIIQGIAEILPISSSGHLALSQSIISDVSGLPQFDSGSPEMMVFNVFTHFASLLALIIFFRKKIWMMLKGTWQFIFNTKVGRVNSRDITKAGQADLFAVASLIEETTNTVKKAELMQELENIKKEITKQKSLTRKNDTLEAKPGFMLTMYMLVASIPVGLVGYFLNDEIGVLFTNLLFIGISFIVTGLILLFVSLFTSKANSDTYTWKNTMITGLFQVIGVIPGISRSGITMSGAKIAGLNDEKAKEFAFILFMPVAAGSFLFSLSDLSLIASMPSLDIIGFILGCVVAFVMTGLALLFIFKKFNLSHYKYFSIYLAIIGTFTIIYSFFPFPW